jgi:UDP-3-O-[3-hydroxymyristoyl] glucosamine N-acyltransferase
LGTNAEVHVLSKIEEGKEGSLTLSNPKYNNHIYSTEAITIVNKSFVPEVELNDLNKSR